MSVPVVVVVHGNQGPNSEATIIWDNMFSVPVSIKTEDILLSQSIYESI